MSPTRARTCRCAVDLHVTSPPRAHAHFVGPRVRSAARVCRLHGLAFAVSHHTMRGVASGLTGIRCPSCDRRRQQFPPHRTPVSSTCTSSRRKQSELARAPSRLPQCSSVTAESTARHLNTCWGAGGAWMRSANTRELKRALGALRAPSSCSRRQAPQKLGLGPLDPRTHQLSIGAGWGW